jgi:hypothetical protein
MGNENEKEDIYHGGSRLSKCLLQSKKFEYIFRDLMSGSFQFNTD